MYLFMILLIIVLIIMFLYKNEKKEMKIEIKSIKPKYFRKQKKEIKLEPVDLEYYNKLKKAREQLKESRKHNYNMNKGTINNEVAELPEDNLVEIVELRLPAEFILDDLFNNNNQNVHDTTVQDTIKKKFFYLKQNNKNKNVVYNIDQILDYAKKNNKIKNKVMEDNFKLVLNEIVKRNSNIINLNNATEVDVLNLVWNEEQLRDQIVNELFDCLNLEYKTIVCPTGVVSRLLNADIVLNPQNSPRTIELLRTEMLNIAANIRKKCENDETYKKLEETKQNEILKKEIKTKLNETYKDIISSDIIQKELDSWIDYI